VRCAGEADEVFVLARRPTRPSACAAGSTAPTSAHAAHPELCGRCVDNDGAGETGGSDGAPRIKPNAVVWLLLSAAVIALDQVARPGCWLACRSSARCR
jgi:hypothetical protein